MKISLLIVVAAFALLASAVAAQNPTGPKVSIPFSSCVSGASILEVTSLTGQNVASAGPLMLQTILEYESNEEITSGTFNISVTGGGGSSGIPLWGDSSSGSLGNVMLLPISEGAGTWTYEFPVELGYNNFTLAAFDQNQEEIFCLTFDYLQGPVSATATAAAAAAAKKQNNKLNNNNKKHQPMKQIINHAAPARRSIRRSSHTPSSIRSTLRVNRRALHQPKKIA